MAEIDWDKVKDKAQSVGIFIYWIVGLIIAFTISYVLYTRFDKQVASLLVFMASVMALYYYYVKWFVIGDDYQLPTSFCPDLLTFKEIVTIGGNKFRICVDSTSAYPNSSALPAGTPNYTSEANGNVALAAGGYVAVPMPNSSTDSGYSTRIASFCALLKQNDNKISWISVCENMV
jgi:hypothetical protein